ncbi:MAG: aminoacetone oxidase family FAD-binding enzyme, partial [Clostridia bacterium]|nr:aminoacetone oxidase family FAD-binding enzyme [Clostridia bacterium]
MKTDVVVIGGGPAGLFSAATAAKNGNKVILVEKNQILARKLRITGKGRCNVTNSADISDFIEMVCSNKSFMYSSFYSFTNTDVMEFFENNGVPLKEERGGRIFPVSDRAKDIAEALISYAKNNGVVILQDTVTKVVSNENEICAVETSGAKKIECNKVIIATGGVSYPLTGSTGDGYKFAKKLGHSIVEPYPSLVPLVVSEEYVKELQGLSLKNIAIKIFKDKKCVYEDFGEMLFTHYGLSGPVILSASSNLKDIENSNYKIYTDLKPA